MHKSKPCSNLSPWTTYLYIEHERNKSLTKAFTNHYHHSKIDRSHQKGKSIKDSNRPEYECLFYGTRYFSTKRVGSSGRPSCWSFSQTRVNVFDRQQNTCGRNGFVRCKESVPTSSESRPYFNHCLLVSVTNCWEPINRYPLYHSVRRRLHRLGRWTTFPVLGWLRIRLI